MATEVAKAVSTDPPLLSIGKTWEEMPRGSRFRTGARTITEADLLNFVGSHGFTDPLFMDARHAEAEYSGRLIPGALTYCLAEGLVLQSNAIYGTALGFLHMEFDIRAPVFVGDTIDVVVEVTESRASSKPGCGLVTTHNTIRNQNRKTVATFTPVRLIRGRDFDVLNKA
jgi:acyl dehydratase